MKPILRVPLAILVTAAAVSLGAAGVHASTQCVRFIRQKVRHHRVSAATAARWAVWDKAHPKWHPKPTPQETWEKLDFACEVPMVEKPLADLLPAPQLAPLVLPLEMSAPPETPMVAMNSPAPELFPEQPSESLVSPPIYAPQYPALFGPIPTPSKTGPPSPPVGATPEPSAWVLLATAVFAMGGLMWKRQRELVQATVGVR
jgi:hypothetical protein